MGNYTKEQQKELALSKLESLGLDCNVLERLKDRFELVSTIQGVEGDCVVTTLINHRIRKALNAFEEISEGEPFYVIDNGFAVSILFTYTRCSKERSANEWTKACCFEGQYPMDAYIYYPYHPAMSGIKPIWVKSVSGGLIRTE